MIDNQEKTLVCLRLLRKALFLVRTLKPKVLALLNQANSPAQAGCMGAGISASKVRLSNTCIPRRTAAMRRRSVRSTANRGAISPYQRCLILRGSEKCTCFGYIGLLWAVSSSLHATWFMKSNWSFNFTNGRCWSKLRLLLLAASSREQPNIFVKPNTSAKYNVSIQT